MSISEAYEEDEDEDEEDLSLSSPSTFLEAGGCLCPIFWYFNCDLGTGGAVENLEVCFVLAMIYFDFTRIYFWFNSIK